MTREQLDAIRARLDEVPRIPWNASLLRLLNDDASALLVEVERLTAERDAAKPKASTVCTFLMPSGRWSWFVTPGPLAASVVTHLTRQEAEEAAKAHAEWAGWPRVDRFNGQAEALDVSVERDSFKRGVAAMREAAIQAVTCPAESCPCSGIVAVSKIRALPDPEDKP